MSARDYSDFLARLSREFPNESFLLVRCGDHQPAISAQILEPSLDSVAVAQRIMLNDLRYFTTYYAIDTINFTPVDVSSARGQIEAPYLPLVLQEAAGVPSTPPSPNKSKFSSCNGLFYRCNGGAGRAASTGFLIDAGLMNDYSRPQCLMVWASAQGKRFDHCIWTTDQCGRDRYTARRDLSIPGQHPDD